MATMRMNFMDGELVMHIAAAKNPNAKPFTKSHKIMIGELHFAEDCLSRWGSMCFEYQYNPSVHDLNMLDIIECLISDADAYAGRDEADFLYEFGYTDSAQSIRDGLRAYKMCKSTWDDMHKMFSDAERKELRRIVDERRMTK